MARAKKPKQLLFSYDVATEEFIFNVFSHEDLIQIVFDWLELRDCTLLRRNYPYNIYRMNPSQFEEFETESKEWI